MAAKTTSRYETWKQSTSAVLGGILGLLIAGELSTQARPSSHGTTNVIRARRFEVIDKANKVRAVLGWEARKTITFTIYDKGGKERVTLLTTDAQEGTETPAWATTSLDLYDRKDNMETHLETNEAGEGELWFGCKQQVGSDLENFYRYAQLKASAVHHSAGLRLSALGDGSFLWKPEKDKSVLELTAAHSRKLWTDADNINSK